MQNKPHVRKEFIVAANSQKLNIEELLRKALNMEEPQPSGWTTKGVTFPAGTFFRAWHGDRPYWGEVTDGALLLNGKRYTSVSAAAESFTQHPTNGWAIWECKFPGSKEWKRIGALRQEARR